MEMKVCSPVNHIIDFGGSRGGEILSVTIINYQLVLYEQRYYIHNS